MTIFQAIIMQIHVSQAISITLLIFPLSTKGKLYSHSIQVFSKNLFSENVSNATEFHEK